MSARKTLALCLVLGTGACGPGGGTYCQTGPKYGTKCYSNVDVSNAPGYKGPPDQPEQRKDSRQR
ncbi:MAG: hypothetical protein JW940_10725 [Polyangiaceae bacterium]|nr:hypothetical protein [Polyangiaceae bacterium]